jgi:hypothetical protein
LLSIPLPPPAFCAYVFLHQLIGLSSDLPIVISLVSNLLLNPFSEFSWQIYFSIMPF